MKSFKQAYSKMSKRVRKKIGNSKIIIYPYKLSSLACIVLLLNNSLMSRYFKLIWKECRRFLEGTPLTFDA